MSKLVIISGTPGTGKTTTAQLLAKRLAPVAEIYTDEIRHKVTPYELPWVEPEGKRQLWLGIESACAAARVYLNGGFNVVMNDVLIPEAHERYNDLLGSFNGVTVLLKPSLEVALARAKPRKKTVPEEQIKSLHNRIKPEDFDIVIDNSNIEAEEAVQLIIDNIDTQQT